MRKFLLLVGALALAASVFARQGDKLAEGLNNAIILVIRHAEKPASGEGLSPAGEARAQAYADYFKNYMVDGQPLKLDYLYAAADSKNSQRPNLTLDPLSLVLPMAVNARFSIKKPAKLVSAIRQQPPGGQYLICWHHGAIPQLLSTLGADPATLLPRKNKWPGDEYGWVMQLRYDANGKLISATRVEENLMPDDGKARAPKPKKP